MALEKLINLEKAPIVVSDTPPSITNAGSIWYESDSGKTFIYYDNAWIEVGGSAYDSTIGLIQAKGDLIAGTQADAVDRLAVGTDNQRLIANTTANTGLSWASDTYNTLIDAKGDLIVGASDNTAARLATSTTDGAVLIADSTATNGLSWQTQNTGVRNLLYNGAMQVAQRGTSTSSITAPGYYTADRWYLQITTLGTWTQATSAGVAGTDDLILRAGFRNFFKMTCSTADASPASADLCIIEQLLEGQDLQSICKGTTTAQQVTLSFWVKSGVTGTYICRLRDNDNDRSVSKSYTISAANTWEYKTLTFSADTTGIFDNDNALSLRVQFWLAAGSNFTSGTLQTTWGTSVSANIAPGIVNLASGNDSAVNYWQITGVQLNVGPVAAPFEFKSYERELRECQRYYQTSYNTGSIGTATYTGAKVFLTIGASNTASGVVNFPVVMRDTPNMTCYNPQTGSSGGFYNLDLTSSYTFSSFSGVGQTGFYAVVGGASISSGVQRIAFHYIAEKEL